MVLKKTKFNFDTEQKEIVDLIKLIQSAKFNIAENKAVKLIKQYPNSFNVLNLLGLCLVNQNQINKGINCYNNAIKIKPDFAQAHNNLGIALKDAGKINSAINCYQNAIKFKSDFAEAYNNLGLIMMDQGKIKDAKINFKKALKIKPSLAYVHRHLSIVTKYKKKDPHIKEMKKTISNLKTSDNGKMHVAFGLGKAFEDIKDYENAFKYFELGNRLRRKKIQYDIKSDINFFNSLKKIFDGNLFEKFKTSKKNLDGTPIFIVGMFRSGTTLIEQILSSHPNVFGGGESKTLAQAISKYLHPEFQVKFPEDLIKYNPITFDSIGKIYIEAARSFQPNYKHITDKQPHNFKWIGLIKLALPNAKIIHCIRNPLDNCLSIYKNYFNFNDNPYAYNLEELGQYYNIYKELMKYWHSILPDFIYDISYEKLINNQKEETKKLLDACNLSWDEQCMDFFKNKRYVSTASVMQVRRPIYKHSINSWESYKKHLPPLIKILK